MGDWGLKIIIWLIPFLYLSPLLLVWKNSILNWGFLPGQLPGCFAFELAIISSEPDINTAVIVAIDVKNNLFTLKFLSILFADLLTRDYLDFNLYF